MYQTQLAITEIKRFIRRRKVILILAPLLLTGLSVAAALMLPPKYESSITILVERDETLNPMIQYTMAVAMASEDRLRSFNEIIYSRSTVNMLIDSLDLADDTMINRERDGLIKRVRGNIRTHLRASNSFSISYLNEDPALAQKGTNLLSQHFLQTRLSMETRRNEQTVEFFENKLEELEQAVQEREQRMLAQMQDNTEQVTREDRAIKLDIDRVNATISETERSIGRSQRNMETLQAVNQGERDLESIRELDLSTLPSGGELRENMNQYRNYTQRYTDQYPGVRELANDIHDLVERIIVEMEADLFEKQTELAFLTEQRTELVNQLEQTTVTQQQRSGVRSDYDVYKAMLDEMKVKVEQARSTRELGDRSQNQFIVIDKANLPETPAKPNRQLLVAGGLLVGLFLGVVGAGFAELLDTTIRRPEDLQSFNKPIVAFVPHGDFK